MASPKITIQFQGKGGGALKKTLEDLHLANVKLTKGQRAFVKEQRKLQKETDKANKQLKEQELRTRNLHGTFSVARSKLLLFSFAMTLALDPIRRMVKASSDANEILNKSSVVFGENMKVVSQWAASLGAAVGRADSTLLEMASSLQDLFVPMGYSRAAATELSTSLTELAIDVASFSNKVDADVLNDFQSAIVGNHKSVRKYGVVITESTLKQAAYNMGLTETVRELSENEKVQTRIALITAGSADAMGDAQRTAGEYAQSLVRFNETWKEIFESVGEALKPILAVGLAFGSDKQKIVSYAIAVGGVATVYIATTKATTALTISTKALSKTLRATPWFIGVFALSALANKALEVAGVFDDNVESLDDLKDSMKETSDATAGFTLENEKLVAQQQNSENQLRTKLALLDLELKAMQSKSSFEQFLIDVEKKQITASKGREGSTSDLTQVEKDLLIAIQARTLETKVAIKQDQRQEKIFDKAYNKKLKQYQDEIEAQRSKVASELEQNNHINRQLEDHRKNKEANTQAVLDETQKEKEALEAMISVRENAPFLGVSDEVLQQQRDYVDTLAKQGAHLLTNTDHEEGLVFARENSNKRLEEQNSLLADMENNLEGLKKSAEDTAKGLMNFDALEGVFEGLVTATGELPINFTSMFEDMQGAFDENLELFGEKGNNMGAAYLEMGTQLAESLVSMQNQSIEANMESIKRQGKAQLEEEKKSRKWQKKSARAKKEREAEILADTNAKLAKEFKGKQQMAYAGVLMDTGKAIMKSVAASPLTGGMPWTAIVSAMGAAQLAMVSQQKPPQAATGGLIGGNRHSQGGTIIEAEQGEFIMNRDAVDAVGVETMNRINMGGGASGANITFSGNVMSDDFIENEAIPKIKEAVRRGSDIGVS